MDAETAQIVAAIGPRLRALRRERGLALATVAARTGLSVSALSRLETGHRQPTLDLLLPLAKLYRVALDQLVAAPDTGDPRMHLRPHHHASGGVVVPLTGYPGRVQVFKHVLGPREPRLVSHAGHAWLFVLAGTLRLLLGDDEHLLGPGETAEFDPLIPHWFGPVGDAVEILHLFGPHGHKPVARVVRPPDRPLP
ncbi:helix-turn-helix domain-containing protein [Nocardia sp. NPDC004415]